MFLTEVPSEMHLKRMPLWHSLLMLQYTTCKDTSTNTIVALIHSQKSSTEQATDLVRYTARYTFDRARYS